MTEYGMFLVSDTERTAVFANLGDAGSATSVCDTVTCNDRVWQTYRDADSLVEVSPTGRRRRTVFNSVGLPSSYTAPEAPDAGRRLDRTYDAAREQTALVKPDGTVVSNLYDSAGRLAAVVATRGSEEERVSLAYDWAGRLESVSAEGGETTYRIVADNQGSVRLVVDAATGAVAQRLDYDSFGRVIRDTNPGFQPFGFQGGLYDPDTGLVEFGCRWYDAQTGRWISKDPILLDGGWNVYAFCDNDPVNRICIVLGKEVGEPWM